MSENNASSFSSSYREARLKFLSAAKKDQLATVSYVHPALKGPDGEELAIDVVEIIPSNATGLIIVSCGLHGIEGYGGSVVLVLNALGVKFAIIPFAG